MDRDLVSSSWDLESDSVFFARVFCDMAKSAHLFGINSKDEAMLAAVYGCRCARYWERNNGLARREGYVPEGCGESLVRETRREGSLKYVLNGWSVMQATIKDRGDNAITSTSGIPQLCKDSARGPGGGGRLEWGGELPALDDGLLMRVGGNGGEIESLRWMWLDGITQAPSKETAEYLKEQEQG